VSPKPLDECEDQLGVDGHAGLGTRNAVGCEQLVVVGDRAVVDPDDRSVADRVVVRLDARVALRVVPDVQERLGRCGRDGDLLQEGAGSRSLLANGHRAGVRAIRVPDGVGAPLGDSGEQSLRGERPVDVAAGAQAVSGNSAHKLEALDPLSATTSRSLTG
jgi:hypothetical protein